MNRPSSHSRTIAAPAPEVHAIILTRDEEIHIERCIRSLTGICASITVVDSGSTDRTREIATQLGARVITNKWVNYATQLNFGIHQLSSLGGWLLRIDADELLPTSSMEMVKMAIGSAEANGHRGILVRRRIYFLGRRIRFGGIEPSWQLRLWKNGYGACEARWMDEHVKVNGTIARSSAVIEDRNLKTLTWWTDKHNTYASREVIDMLLTANEPAPAIGLQAKIRRIAKTVVYKALPPGARAFGYFLWRYIFRLGFMDGWQGFYFHALQGLWYRLLVDVKMLEALSLIKLGALPADALSAVTGISIPTLSDRAVDQEKDKRSPS